jgi:hypothetical protein
MTQIPMRHKIVREGLKFPSFLGKNYYPPAIVEGNPWGCLKEKHQAPTKARSGGRGHRVGRGGKEGRGEVESRLLPCVFCPGLCSKRTLERSLHPLESYCYCSQGSKHPPPLTWGAQRVEHCEGPLTITAQREHMVWVPGAHGVGTGSTVRGL